MRIIPLTLRITSYSAAPPEWPGRPTIHIEGGLAGQSNDLSDARRVHGKVEMVGNGDIRWSLCSEREDGDGEWQSEGVQLGGLGSATGVIGMWTGADHERMDPLGPFWAWKVGHADISDEATTVEVWEDLSGA
ncbi:hypothetical protein HETIRDRAFT_411796 [Heterobasidion irregulare TC 32-1]|uniref:Uncharacterized protein n=1 Tax=Heterobasidion irregulare (strain TC 32-1) TaxID=747525 RepID=W4JS18_HETIT|nr:uncharacterized protein HETIRDRAFT_411796 [Heterobasidion irregulare TC 32-1]ETW76347.1 hypothetical protein HETIRDRAFT_411796 [Heterobasidion irregulare TC 32-1]